MTMSVLPKYQTLIVFHSLTHSLSSVSNRSKSQSSYNKNTHSHTELSVVWCLSVHACACVVCVSFVLYNLDYLICKIIMNVCCLLLLLLCSRCCCCCFCFFSRSSCVCRSFCLFRSPFSSYSITLIPFRFFFLLILFANLLWVHFFPPIYQLRTKYKVIYVSLKLHIEQTQNLQKHFTSSFTLRMTLFRGSFWF